MQIEAYFERFHFLLPVLDKISFLEDYRKLMEEDGNHDDAGFVSVVFAVFACAARFVDDPRLTEGVTAEEGGVGMIYYERYDTGQRPNIVDKWTDLPAQRNDTLLHREYAGQHAASTSAGLRAPRILPVFGKLPAASVAHGRPSCTDCPGPRVAREWQSPSFPPTMFLKHLWLSARRGSYG